MKGTNIIVLVASLMLGMAAFADQRNDRKLWVAIDDGSEDGGLFINLDSDRVVANLDELQVTNLQTLQGVVVRSALPVDAITIISNQILDDTTKEKIETVLSLSGHTGEVVFIGRNRISSHEEIATN